MIETTTAKLESLNDLLAEKELPLTIEWDGILWEQGGSSAASMAQMFGPELATRQAPWIEWRPSMNQPVVASLRRKYIVLEFRVDGMVISPMRVRCLPI